MAALMFVDAKTAVGSSKWPVVYPADGQSGVPLEFGSEVPNPVPGGARPGYPITIQFPPFNQVTGVHAKLVDERGKDVGFYLPDPEHPASSFGQDGVVSSFRSCRFARRAATTYDTCRTHAQSQGRVPPKGRE